MDPAERAKWQMMQQCWAVGHWERMEAMGRDLLATRPADAELLSALGVAVFQLGRREEAARCFRQALASEPDHAPSHAMMGWYWARRRKFGQAEQCLQKALSLDPSCDRYWVELGHVMLMQGNQRGARTCAAKALALNAENVSAVALESEADGRSEAVGRPSPQARRERVLAALGLEPENADLHEALGEIYDEEGRLREAEERFREALALDPSRPWLWRKVRRMGLKRDGIDRVLSAPWRLGLWLLREGDFITILLGLVVCAGWGLVIGPISFLYRLMFRIELGFLAARGTRSVAIPAGRRILRMCLLGIAAAVYWSLVWWLARQEATWSMARWVVTGATFVLIGAGIRFSMREMRAELRHRRTLRELEGGWSEGE